MNSKPSDTCKIRVLDKDYIINCQSSERDMLMKSADFLNQRIKETRASGTLSGGEKIVVMTALNLVYDYLNTEKIKVTKSEIASTEPTESKIEDNDKTAKKLKQINKKIETALHQHQQIELT
jgi:cell division protein ZapA